MAAAKKKAAKKRKPNAAFMKPVTPDAVLSAVVGNKPLPRTEPIYFEHEGNRALRDGQWKLVAKGPGGKWELYNMLADRTETHDLASTEPAKLKELIAKWEAWAKRAEAIPWPHTPQYGEATPDTPAKKGKKKQ